ncbi:hypothetical protein OH492_08010 [Vibrio chagasii]|nr:hypothetical protein [Vibrio chagasii]
MEISSVYDQYRPILIKKAGVSASQLMTTATVFNQQGNVQDANQLNALLDTMQMRARLNTETEWQL